MASRSRLFHTDHQHPSQFRNASWSPDSKLFAVPGGKQADKFCCHIFHRSKIFSLSDNLSLVSLKPVVGCSFNPSLFSFGYILAVYTLDQVIIYRIEPTGEKVVTLLHYFDRLHYDQLTEIVWVGNDTILVSSRDGFITVLKFDLNTDFYSEEFQVLGRDACMERQLEFTDFEKSPQKIQPDDEEQAVEYVYGWIVTNIRP